MPSFTELFTIYQSLQRLMQLDQTPTNLQIYYDSIAKGIVATTDFTAITDLAKSQASFWNEDNLILLSTDDYKDNFDINSYPFPQNIILFKFFRYSQNTVELLLNFSDFGILSLLGKQIEILEEIPTTHIIVKSDLKTIVELITSTGEIIFLRSKTPVAITSIIR